MIADFKCPGLELLANGRLCPACRRAQGVINMGEHSMQIAALRNAKKPISMKPCARNAVSILDVIYVGISSGSH